MAPQLQKILQKPLHGETVFFSLYQRFIGNFSRDIFRIFTRYSFKKSFKIVFFLISLRKCNQPNEDVPFKKQTQSAILKSFASSQFMIRFIPLLHPFCSISVCTQLLIALYFFFFSFIFVLLTACSLSVNFRRFAFFINLSFFMHYFRFILVLFILFCCLCLICSSFFTVPLFGFHSVV